MLSLESKPLRCLVWIMVVLAHYDFGVDAFQSTSFERYAPFCIAHSKTGCLPVNFNGRIHGARATGWYRVDSQFNVPLTMASSDESQSTTGKISKRKRIKEKVKKIISYPKNKIRTKIHKIRNAGEEIDSILPEPTTGSVHGAGDHSEINGEISNDASMDSNAGVNGGSAVTASPMTHETEKNAAIIIEESEPTVGEAVEGTNGSAATSKVVVVPTNGEAAQRSATAQSVDLSGKWQLIVSEEFKTSYDHYLKQLGQPALVRSVALSIIGMTTEETFQSDEGRELKIRGRNARGNWERILTASTQDSPLVVPIVTADHETVQSECWWEENGSIHRSWLRGVQKYGGGDFESRRYLEEDGKRLVCESTFHPDDSSREQAHVVWKFRRVDDGRATDAFA